MDIYRNKFFLQNGSLDGVQRTVTKAFDDGSIICILTCNATLLSECEALLSNHQIESGLEGYVAALQSRQSSLLSETPVFFLLLNPTEDIMEFVSQDMPPVLVKKKDGELLLLEKNINLTAVSVRQNSLTRIAFNEIGIMVLVNDKRIMTELKNRAFVIFAKCELEKVIKSFSNSGTELNVSYFVLNNTLRENIKFSHYETIPAKLDRIASFEKELENILKDSYPKAREINDNALMVFNELLLNAYEHGTLGIDSNTKQAIMFDGTYEDHLEALEANNDGVIEVEIVIYKQNLLKISIKDSGQGFDFTEFDCKEKSISENLLHGRGIQMANQICSTAYYEDGGSKVTFFMKYETKEMIGGFIHSEEAMLSEMSILYVEDDPAIRQQFARIIQRMVGELYVAGDGQEGLEMYRMEHPDMVLTDIEMPKMNGLDMAEKIKEINHDQSILIMTAYNQDDKFLRAIDIGVDKYVIKPVKIEQLKNALYTTAKQIFFKREAMRLMKEKEQNDATMLMALQSENRYALAQQDAAFKKQELIIHDDSSHYKDERCKVFYKPLERLSGDIYGVFRVDEKRTLLYIIDSMGKGLAASVTAVLSAAYINRAVEMALQSGRFDFERLIADYRDYIRKYLLDDECVSFSMILVDLGKGEFCHSSFGMYPILLKDCNTLEITEHRSNNAPLTKYLSEIIISKPLPLPKFFGIFLFSDGLVETELFGMQELLYHLKVGEEDEEITLFNRVMDKSFVADDDVTLIHFSSGCENL